MTTAKPPLPIALTISGAVALGAYEGGVLAALLHGLEPLYRGDEPRVRIDAIGGASAGSITGLLAARCIAEGIDAFNVMRSAWVEHAAFAEMRAHNLTAPLTVEPLEELAATLLASPGKPANRQRTPVKISMALGALRGLEYEIAGPFSTSPLRATTFLDWKDATVSPGQDLSDFVHTGPRPQPGVGVPKLVDYALASGANPLGFSPRIVNRSDDAATYRRHYVDNFPKSEAYWYTDGGTLDNEPLGRTLELVGDLDRDGNAPRRLLILIHPHPTAAPSGAAWSNPHNAPTWVETLVRAQRLQTTQSIYDDLRHADKTNRRVAALDDLAAVLAEALAEVPQPDGIDTRLAAFLDAADRGRVERGGPELARPETRTTEELLRAALAVAAGLSGKQQIGIEVLSPLLLPEARGAHGEPVEHLLAGEFLFHFGGFAREALRKQDFDLGYRTVTEWFERDRPLTFHGLDESADECALEAAKKRYKPAPPDAALGKTGYNSLSRKERRGFIELLARTARIAFHDWRHPTHQ